MERRVWQEDLTLILHFPNSQTINNWLNFITIEVFDPCFYDADVDVLKVEVSAGNPVCFAFVSS